MCGFLFLSERVVFLSQLLSRVFRKNDRVARGKVNNEVSEVSGVSLGFFAHVRALLLLSAVLLTPLTLASASSLLSLDAAARVIYALALLFPLAIFFYLLEGWCLFSPNSPKTASPKTALPKLNLTQPNSERETSALELFFARAFSPSTSTSTSTSTGTSTGTNTGTNLWGVASHRLAIILFASGFLLFLLFSMLPQMAGIFFEQSARLFLSAQSEFAPALADSLAWSSTWLVELFFGLSLRQAVVMITLLLLSALSFPLLFARPLRVITLLLSLLLPLALFFYGTLCFFMLQQSLAYAQQPSGVELAAEAVSISALGSFLPNLLPSFTRVELSSSSFTDFLLMFRPAFGYFALACVASSATTMASKRRNFSFGNFSFGFSFGNFSFGKRLNFVFSFFLLLVLCFTLLFFITLTLLVILATGSWTLGELGFASLYAAFTSLYPGESWLLASSIALLALTALLGLSAFCLLALRLLSRNLFASNLLARNLLARNLEHSAVFLFLPLGTWGAYSASLAAHFSARGFFGFSRFELLLQSLGSFGLWLSALVFMLALGLVLLRRLRLRLGGIFLRRVAFSEDLARGF